MWVCAKILLGAKMMVFPELQAAAAASAPVLRGLAWRCPALPAPGGVFGAAVRQSRQEGLGRNGFTPTTSGLGVCFPGGGGGLGF